MHFQFEKHAGQTKCCLWLRKKIDMLMEFSIYLNDLFIIKIKIALFKINTGTQNIQFNDSSPEYRLLDEKKNFQSLFPKKVLVCNS